jgi:ribonuclease VapC
MSRVVLDASAILAILRKEKGADHVKRRLRGAMVSSVNIAEVLCVSRTRGASPEVDAWMLDSMELERVPFDEDHARVVASIFRETSGGNIGFADRACLALGLLKGLPVLTGDGEWKNYKLGIEVELFR